MYYVELARWNQRINLTALPLEEGGSDSAVDRLLIEPLVAARCLPAECSSLIDIGSGGGSPAIPLKLARQGLSLTMVEAKVRKSAFLRQIARYLRLQNTTVETARFQELLSRPHFHESFDCASIRAVRVDQAIWNGVQAFLKAGSTVLHFTTDRLQGQVPVPLTAVQTVLLTEDGTSRLAVLRKELAGRRST
jgi:16S rRNA (guanine527-N7)-methyltransferase